MVIVCDCYYRSAITAIRLFHNSGEKVIAVTTESCPSPSSFHSFYPIEKIVLSSDKAAYTEELINLCRKYDMPILFSVGNFTLNVISENIDRFEKCSLFCVSEPNLLKSMNDKKWVKEQAIRCGISVPKQYSINGKIEFPVIVKPFCGEKFNIKASERYIKVNNTTELKKAYEHFKKFDDSPLIEEYISGYGAGVCVLLDKNSKILTAFCHKRIVEYPINGGPSSCLETFFDKDLIEKTAAFFENNGFTGIAMAEYKITPKGKYLLEINPRVWGSFPALAPAKSNYIEEYIKACKNLPHKFNADYVKNKKIKFMRGMIASFSESVKSKKYANAIRIFLYIINPLIPPALFSLKDPLPALYDFFRRNK